MVNKDEIEKIKKYQSNFSETNPVRFLPEEATLVMMEEYAIASATDSPAILGSFGASSCLILAIRDNVTTMTLLTHITTMTILSSLEALLSQFPPENSVIHLIGGHLIANNTSLEMCLRVIDMIEKMGIPIINADVVRTQRIGGAMAIDARTGEVFTPVTKSNFFIPLNFNQRLINSVSMSKQILRKTPTDSLTPPLVVSMGMFAMKKKGDDNSALLTVSADSIEPRRIGRESSNRVSLANANGSESSAKTKTEADISFAGFKKGFLL